MEYIVNFLQQTGFSMIAADWKVLVMIAIACVLAYLAIHKGFEPSDCVRYVADEPSRRRDVS